MPGAGQGGARGIPTRRIRGRISCVRTTIAPGRFLRLAHLGPKGWIGLRLARRVDRDKAAALVRCTWRMTAPRRPADSLTASPR